MRKNRGGFYLFSAVLGLHYCTATKDDIDFFLDRCGEGGVRRIVTGTVPDQPMPHNFGYLIEGGHKRGMEMMSYIAIGWQGHWEWIYHSNVGEPLPEPVLTPFIKKHPEAWTRTREGRIWLAYDYRHMLGTLGYMNFYNAEARQCEQERALELVSYGLDGFQLEWVASPRPPSDPEKGKGKHTIDWCLDENGYWGFGYDEEAIEGFKAKYGEDPRQVPSYDERWVDFRCESVTQYVREMKGVLDKTGRDLEISAQGVSGIFRSPEAGRQVNFDWATWAKEGLIDAVYPRWPAKYPKLHLAYDEETVANMGPEVAGLKKILGDRCDLMAGLLLPTYSQLTRELVSPDKAAGMLEAAVQGCVDNGADMVGIYRTDRFHALGLWPYLKNLTRIGDQIA